MRQVMSISSVLLARGMCGWEVGEDIFLSFLPYVCTSDINNSPKLIEIIRHKLLSLSLLLVFCRSCCKLNIVFKDS